MDRTSELLRHITKDQLGIEIAPWFSPLTAKRDGYNCLTLDVLPREELLTRASKDPRIDKERLADVEHVDLVGSATEIEALIEAAGLLGKIDYIISSHNFEHLPNPLRFLEGCGRALKPGGRLIMAIPDHRGCFDFFRSVTALPEWLQAHTEQRSLPTPEHVFTQRAFQARRMRDGGEDIAFSIADDPSQIVPIEVLRQAFKSYRASKTNPDAVYRDSHCGVYTPASFEVLLRDCVHLGLVNFAVDCISETNLSEFYVHLAKANDEQAMGDTAEFYARRACLLHEIKNEIARTSTWGWQQLSACADLVEANRQLTEQDCREWEKSEPYKQSAAEISRLQAEVDALRNSMSWRISAPLRQLASAWASARSAINRR